MEPEIIQRRKLVLQASKFTHIAGKITQSLQLDNKIEDLENWRHRLNTVAADFENMLLETVAVVASDEERDDIMSQQITVSDKLLELQSQLESEIRIKTAQQQRVEAASPPPGTPGSDISSMLPQILPAKLPRLQLPTFDGKVESWDSFWDQYNALVHSRNDIAAVSKLHYLRGQMSGPPLQLIEGFSVTDNNYDQAIQLLKVTYENPSRARRQFTKNFLAMKRPQYKVEDLMQFRAQLESTLRCLENLQCDIGNSDWVLSVIISEKLPSQVMETIQRKVDDDYPTLKQIRKHLMDVINHLATQTPSNHYRTESNTSNGKNVISSKIQQSSTKPTQPSTARWTTSIAPCATNKSKPQFSTQTRTCLFCKGDHPPVECMVYRTRAQKQQQLKQLGRCIKCCRVHDAKVACDLRECYRCKEGKHHTFLCEKSPTPKSTVASAVSKNETTALPIANIGVVRRKSTTSHRALLDTGSQRTFILASLANDLGLKPITQVQLKVEGFLRGSETKTFDVVNITLKMGRQYFRVKALVTDYMPQQVTIHGLTEASKHLRGKANLNNPHPQSDHIDGIELLIGTDQYFKIVKGQSRIDGVNMIQTASGYIIAGTIPSRFTPRNITQNVAIVARVETCTLPSVSETPLDIERRVEELWTLETLGIVPENDTPEERWVKNDFANTVTYAEDQYWVRLPWKVTHPKLESNYNRCYARTKKNYETLLGNQSKLQAYHEVANQQIESRFVEKVPEEQINNEAHYLPQVCVNKDSKTTPLRVVYDCSAKTNEGVSLNDCLYTGPSLVEELGRVMVKFRTNEWAFTADISKAFLRVGLLEQDRDYTRFLMPHHYGVFEPPNIYRFRSVLFGSTSSPFLLQAVLNYHLTVRHEDNPYALKIRDSLYVDNLQGTTSHEAELTSIYESAHELLKEAAMPLQEWHSNSPFLQQRIALDYPEQELVDRVKILGMNWNVNDDRLNICPVVFTEVNTKRELLSNCSKIYDPLGLLTPITTQFRMLMQETWRLRLHWDETLPEYVKKQWQECKSNSAGFEQIDFPRATSYQQLDYELHIFCDASPKAYGAVAYLVNPAHTPHILISKARIAPLEKRTLPQLELTAILVGCRLANYIESTLTYIKILQTMIWTDSQVSLAWIAGDRSDIKYVRNRVADIHKEQPFLNLQYVSSKENPADLITKALSVRQLTNKSQLWCHGPEWLQYTAVRTGSCIIAPAVAHIKPSPIMDYTKYSTLRRLTRVTALVFQAVKLWRRSFSPPDPLLYWIKNVQSIAFEPEYTILMLSHANPQTHPSHTVPQHKKSALVRDLNLYMQDGILRTYGRITYAELPYSTKHPILLPKKNHLTNLIIRHHHITNLHSGTNQTLAKIRENYWIPQGRQQIKNQIKNCKLCKRFEGTRYRTPPTPPLPAERVQDAAPFEIIGVDYSGAITLKQGDTEIKTYVCLFTCATTRAVHLELAEDLTAETFINLLRRLIARRSCPRIIISDNATNFRAGAEFLAGMARNEYVQEHLGKHNIQWKFIPPRAPWFGGFYERLIGVVKGCLKKCLYKRKITLSELQTILTEIEARVNNRPLTYQTDSIDDPEPITPNHLMLGRTIDTFPLIKQESQDQDYLPEAQTHEQLNERLAYLNRIITRWHEVWKKEYLTSLRERHVKKGENNQSYQQTLKAGDVCMVYDSSGRDTWPLGKILETYPDENGHIRVVKLKTMRGTIIRAIKHLYPLEVGAETKRGVTRELPPQIANESLNESISMSHDEGHANTQPPQPKLHSASAQSDPDSNLEDDPPNKTGLESHQSDLGLSLNVRREPRRAATQCRQWLKGVCEDELSE